MAKGAVRPSRVSGKKVLEHLRVAARKGDPASLALALDQMRTLALSPRYWERYLTLLANPLARLVDLLVIKQGERIARQKGWKLPKPTAAPRARRGGRSAKAPARARRRPPASGQDQPLLFDL